MEFERRYVAFIAINRLSFSLQAQRFSAVCDFISILTRARAGKRSACASGSGASLVYRADDLQRQQAAGRR